MVPVFVGRSTTPSKDRPLIVSDAAVISDGTALTGGWSGPTARVRAEPGPVAVPHGFAGAVVGAFVGALVGAAVGAPVPDGAAVGVGVGSAGAAGCPPPSSPPMMPMIPPTMSPIGLLWLAVVADGLAG